MLQFCGNTLSSLKHVTWRVKTKYITTIYYPEFSLKPFGLANHSASNASIPLRRPSHTDSQSDRQKQQPWRNTTTPSETTCSIPQGQISYSAAVITMGMKVTAKTAMLMMMTHTHTRSPVHTHYTHTHTSSCIYTLHTYPQTHAHGCSVDVGHDVGRTDRSAAGCRVCQTTAERSCACPPVVVACLRSRPCRRSHPATPGARQLPSQWSCAQHDGTAPPAAPLAATLTHTHTHS